MHRLNIHASALTEAEYNLYTTSPTPFLLDLVGSDTRRLAVLLMGLIISTLCIPAPPPPPTFIIAGSIH